MSISVPRHEQQPASARAQLVERILTRRVAPPAIPALSCSRPAGRVVLSSAQAGIWFLSRVYPASAEYNVFETLRLDIAPDESQLRGAVSALMRRRDALRIRVVEVDGEAFQEDGGDCEPPIVWHDLTDCAASRVNQRVREIGDASARRPFALARSPLFRVSAIRLPEGRALLVFVFHHLVVDHWSTVLLLDELCLLLRREDLKPAAPMGFLDYVEWRRGAADPRKLAQHLEYWRVKLGGELPVLDLPGDRPRPAAMSRRGRAVPLAIPRDLVQRLRRFAQEEGTTLFVTLLAAYKVLLQRLTRQPDVIVGAPLAGRDHPIAETIVGCFVRTVALRTILDGDPSFREAVRRTHSTVMEAHDHQMIPFETIVAELKLPRELNYSPVFQTCFGLQPAGRLSYPGASVGGVLLECDSAKWDLTVSLTETASDVTGFVEYALDLFEETTVVRYMQMFVRLLSALVVNPEAAMSGHSLTTHEERDRILERLNKYARPTHRFRTMAEPFEAQVERTPNSIALTGEEGSLTYAALNDSANRLARFLRAKGAGRGERIALCMERSFGMVIALYAVAKCGAAYVPLDPELPDGRLAFMLQDTEPLLLLADRHNGRRFSGASCPTVSMDDDAYLWSALPSHNFKCEGPEHHLVHLLYTSGSTGRPKAVAYPVDGAIANILWLQALYPFGPGDATVLRTSYGFDVSIWEIFWPLYYGATVAVCPPGAHRDPRVLVEWIERHAVTTMFIIPTMMQVFLECLPAGSCRSLRWVFCGGEPVTPRVRDGFHSRLAAQLINCYGPTEAGCVTDMVIAPEPGAPVVPLGRPATHFRLYVLDPQLQPAPIGVPGEAYIGGEVGVAQCYYRRPDLTAERFLPDPFGLPGARMYRTGDLCRYRDDGLLEHLGRLGTQVKARGMRIELAEIERVLCEHETVEDCVALKVEASQGGIVGFVVPTAGTAVNAADVIAHAARMLPRYMVPAEVVTVSAIPVNVNGKADRAALLRHWQANFNTREIVPPRGEQEEKLARIFERVLGVSEVSVTDSFFQLGGHSLLIFKLIAECAKELYAQPSVADIFAAPSIRDLAERLQSCVHHGNTSLIPLCARAGKPLVVFVHAASGSVLPFLEVAKRLEEFSVFGLETAREHAASIETLAARHTRAVDEVRGMSPLILAGWSMGGCIALEMARIWRTRGVEVAAIMMLDTWTPPSVLSSVQAQAQARSAIRQMDVLSLEGFSAAELQAAPEAVADLGRLIECNRDAFLGYAPSWFDGEVTLLRAIEPFPCPDMPIPDECSTGDNGWSSRIRLVNVREIGGNHFTLMARENADILAATIREIAGARVSFLEL